MDTAQLAFAAGFLGYCADQGLSEKEAEALVERAIAAEEQRVPQVKQAIAGAIPWLLGGAGEAVGALGAPALLGALAAPPAIGLGLGLAAGKGFNAVSHNDVEDVMRQELVEDYKRLTAKAERDRQLKLQPPPPTTGYSRF